MSRIQEILFAALAGVFLATSAIAQNPPTASKYAGSVSAGIAFTGGNTDTSNLNLALALTRELKPRNVVKINGLYLRGKQNTVLTLDRTALNARDEYTLSDRTFVFGQTDYFRDTFKDVSYLVAPTGGLGHKLVNGDKTLLVVDGGVGGLFEKNLGLPVDKSGSVSTGEHFAFKVSSAVALTQSVATLWKMDDFGDSLSNFAAGVTSSVSKRLELKIEFLDNYKNRSPRLGIKKNDTAFVTALVVKF
ncbi:MAG TPA: DUF481 domain-containing protein [Terriglobia bacterium]|nr:DUF481 domain-containing protein [Terriglobia bacterium]